MCVCCVLTDGPGRTVVHLHELDVVDFPLVVGLRVAAQDELNLLPSMYNIVSEAGVHNPKTENHAEKHQH